MLSCSAIFKLRTQNIKKNKNIKLKKKNVRKEVFINFLKIKKIYIVIT
jgi:hypothetical protein